MWDPPRPGLEPVSPALAGRFSTTAPPGKPQAVLIKFCPFPCISDPHIRTHFLMRLLPCSSSWCNFTYICLCTSVSLVSRCGPQTRGGKLGRGSSLQARAVSGERLVIRRHLHSESLSLEGESGWHTTASTSAAVLKVCPLARSISVTWEISASSRAPLQNY